MKTRTAPPGSPLRQERFASCPILERGLSANLVALCCSTIATPTDRALLWFVQYLSWLPGGLEKLARELLEAYPLERFPWLVRQRGQSDACSRLCRHLAEFCLDPEFQDRAQLAKLVADHREKWIASRVVVQTEAGEAIAKAMRYARETKTMVLLKGPRHLGKTFAARASCEETGGLMRYVEVPSSKDQATFVRAIAVALGLASNLNLKVQVLTNRIMDALATGELSLCLNFAHFIWPQGRLRHPDAQRVNFVLELGERGIPIVLLSDQRFYSAAKALEAQTTWRMAEFFSEIRQESLPETLSDADVEIVARALLPGADGENISAATFFAQRVAEKTRDPKDPSGPMANLKSLAVRATWLAREDGRDTATADDVRRALDEASKPAHAAPTECLKKAKAPAPQTRRSGFAAYQRPAGGIAAHAAPRATPTALLQPT